MPEKTNSPTKLHPRNKHHGRYDLNALAQSSPALSPHITTNPSGKPTINFADKTAVKRLNGALLKHYYHIEFWDIPDNYLCPPIPGRSDYIHYLADLLGTSNYPDDIPTGSKIKGLDIGTGANLIYPLLANKLYGWRMAGSDIEKTSIASSDAIIQANRLQKQIRLKHQKLSSSIFEGIIMPTERYHFSMCNPPFHTSEEEASQGSERKNRNLAKGKATAPTNNRKKPNLNFGGQHNELWCEGGEVAFIQQMIQESVEFQQQCLWFTTLVARKEHLPKLIRTLKKCKVPYFKEIKMAQGNKTSRFLAWTFHPQEEHKNWFSH